MLNVLFNSLEGSRRDRNDLGNLLSLQNSEVKDTRKAMNSLKNSYSLI